LPTWYIRPNRSNNISEHLCRNTNHAAEDVPVALDGTLKDLQTDYVDLYLVSLQEHRPRTRHASALFYNYHPKVMLVPLVRCIGR
jgi:diketogulonate reductase-like aldo/keto reductase